MLISLVLCSLYLLPLSLIDSNDKTQMPKICSNSIPLRVKHWLEIKRNIGLLDSSAAAAIFYFYSLNKSVVFSEGMLTFCKNLLEGYQNVCDSAFGNGEIIWSEVFIEKCNFFFPMQKKSCKGDLKNAIQRYFCVVTLSIPGWFKIENG